MLQRNLIEDVLTEEEEAIREIYQPVFSSMTETEVLDTQVKMEYAMKVTEINFSEILKLPDMISMSGLFHLSLYYATQMCNLSDEEIKHIFDLHLKHGRRINNEIVAMKKAVH